MEKDISMDNLLDIFNSYFDLNLMKEDMSEKVNLMNNNLSMDQNYYFCTSNTGAQNSTIFLEHIKKENPLEIIQDGFVG
jgi:hypothetical protein